MDVSEDALSVLFERLELLWKYKWLVLAFNMVVLVATVVFTNRQVKEYEASAQMVIDLHAPRYMVGSGQDVVTLGLGNSWNTGEFSETQRRILTSRMVGEMVVQRLGLDRDLNFMGLDKIEDKDLRAEALDKADPVGMLVGRLRAESVGTSRIVEVRYRDTSAERAARIVNEVAEAFKQQNVDRKVMAAREAVAWLRTQEAGLKTEVEAAERALLDFKREHNIMSASLAQQQQLLGADRQNAQQQLRELQHEVTTLGSTLEQVRKMSTAEAQNTVAEVLSNRLVQLLKQQLVTLENERSELLKRYLEKHPDVRTVDRKIKRVKRALEQEVDGIRGALERRYQAMRRSQRERITELKTLEESAKALHGNELAYRSLEGTITSRKTLLSSMQLRLKEAQLQAESRANNVRVLDKARVPRGPVSPRLIINVAVALILGMIGGIALAFLVGQLDNTVKDQRELLKNGLTFLGVIPTIPLRNRPGGPKTDHYVIQNPMSTVAECVRTIRTNLMFMSPGRKMRTMMITSAGPREGKTLTCVNIGVTMAAAGGKVLLVDSDLRRPRLHKVFEFTNERGLTNLIMDEKVHVSDMVKRSELVDIDVLCSGPLPPNPAELLHSANFRRTMDHLLEHYDQVIFDSPPVVAVTDAALLGRMVDGTVLVVQAGRTTRDMLAKATKALFDVNVTVFGALLNNLDVTKRGYGNYYYRYYGRGGGYTSDEQPKTDDQT